MEPLERMQWQSRQAYERPESIAPSVKYLNDSTLFAEMPTANSERPSIETPQTVPVTQALEVFAAAYRDPAPANTRTPWTAGLADLVDPRLIEVLGNTEPPDTG